MEKMHTNRHGDDLLGRMNVSHKSINLNVSAVHPQSFSLQIDSNATSLTEPSSAMECEIEVLLVDHDNESLVSTARMLALNFYQVTMVVSGSLAMKTISAGKKQFDMAVIDVDLPDMDSFQLSREIEKTGIPVIVTSTKEDPQLIYKALDNGAFLLIKKPVDELSTKYIKQFLIKQMILKSKKKMDGEMLAMENLQYGGILFAESTDEDAAQKKRKYMKKNGTKEIGNDHIDQASLFCDQQNLTSEPTSTDNINKKKLCIEWTKELHKKFTDAVTELGEGKCYPKEILELMKVPGLTRMQVASHLQKCRHGNWRSLAERKNQSQKPKISAPPTIGEREKEKIKVFGSMPNLNHKYQAKVQKNIHLVSGPSFGNMPMEKSQTPSFGNGTSTNFNMPLPYFPERENAPERWMEHVDPTEGASLMWKAQGIRILNPTSNPWPLPPPTFNIVPSMIDNNNTIASNYSSIHAIGDGFAPTKEAMNPNINLMPPLKISDVMTSEFFSEDEEINFLLPEFPNIALDNKFENYEFNIRDEVNPPCEIGNEENVATEQLENAKATNMAARRVMKDL